MCLFVFSWWCGAGAGNDGVYRHVAVRLLINGLLTTSRGCCNGRGLDADAVKTNRRPQDEITFMETKLMRWCRFPCYQIIVISVALLGQRRQSAFNLFQYLIHARVKLCYIIVNKRTSNHIQIASHPHKERRWETSTASPSSTWRSSDSEWWWWSAFVCFVCLRLITYLDSLIWYAAIMPHTHSVCRDSRNRKSPLI